MLPISESKKYNGVVEMESTIGLIVSVLIIQLVAIIGARLTVIAVRKFGNIRVLIGLNAIGKHLPIVLLCV